MDAAQALADLTEISSQIRGAVLAGPDGTVVASTFGDEAAGEGVARAGLELLRAAAETRAGGQSAELSHLQAATPEGSVFVVRDDTGFIAAVTGPDPTVGLVFYDLKTCLRLAEEKRREQTPRQTRKKAAAGAATTKPRRTKKDEDA